jgi:alpha-L-arabinofuranosidase
MGVKIHVMPGRVIGKRDPKIYGQFVEHFHRQVYGGIYDPGSPLADEAGLRTDVVAAVREIQPAVMRWPGGCFVSAYHWKDGVGGSRRPVFDKAWRVEESNLFGTHEFMDFCRKIEAEPYICTNAGTGTVEEMSDWVEYCNLPSTGRWARLRAENGHAQPFNVKYWSIGNENYLPGEMGSKTIGEWGSFVREAAKMMKRVDPSIEILAPGIGRDSHYRTAVADFDWNAQLLKEAAPFLTWVSIHGYWDRLNRTSDRISPYESCMLFSTRIEERILVMKQLLGAMGLRDRIRIAFDEWNLRSWHHPNMDAPDEKDYLAPRDMNDLNSQYTSADAVFTACFLNQCLKHCDAVGMANFSPTVNTRGAIFTHGRGIVLRSTWHVFKLYTRYMGDTVVDWWVESPASLDVGHEGKTWSIPAVDAAATVHSDTGALGLALVNRDPVKAIAVEVAARGSGAKPVFRCVAASEKEAFNDIDSPTAVRIEEHEVKTGANGEFKLELPPHSVGVLTIPSPALLHAQHLSRDAPKKAAR